MTNTVGSETDGGGTQAIRSSRRSVLKAGVAAGVGVAVWSTPNIKSIGGTPAYAAVCTVANVGTLLTGCANTRASCTNEVGYKPIFGEGIGTAFGNGGSLVENFSGSGNSNLPPGGCPAAGASVTITVPNDQAGCKLTVILHQNNCTTWVATAYWDNIAQVIKQGDGSAIVERARASTSFVVGPGNSGTVTMPSVNCGSSTIPCSLFWSAVIECNTSSNCV